MIIWVFSAESLVTQLKMDQIRAHYGMINIVFYHFSKKNLYIDIWKENFHFIYTWHLFVFRKIFLSKLIFKFKCEIVTDMDFRETMNDSFSSMIEKIFNNFWLLKKLIIFLKIFKFCFYFGFYWKRNTVHHHHHCHQSMEIGPTRQNQKTKKKTKLYNLE